MSIVCASCHCCSKNGFMPGNGFLVVTRRHSTPTAPNRQCRSSLARCNDCPQGLRKIPFVNSMTLPEGHPENSPAFQRREHRHCNSSPEGTAERAGADCKLNPAFVQL